MKKSLLKSYHLGYGPTLCETFKPFEGVVDKNPILALRTNGGCRRNFQVYIRKLVKVRRVIYGSDLNKYGWRPFAYMLPVHGDGFVEKFQSLDFVQASQSFVGVATKLFNGSFGAFGYGHLWWKDKGVFPKHDLLVSLSGVLRAERWVSDQNFKHDHAKGPPVTG